MRDRKNVILILFDVPVGSRSERKEYTLFRKNLIREGYVRLQKSVYVKLLRNEKSLRGEMESVKGYLPETGEVTVIPLPMGVFRGMETLLGPAFDMTLFSEDIVYL